MSPNYENDIYCSGNGKRIQWEKCLFKERFLVNKLRDIGYVSRWDFKVVVVFLSKLQLGQSLASITVQSVTFSI